MPDAVFNEPRLADIYDDLDPNRNDLDAYIAIVHEFGARSAIDIGCGTGTLATMLAAQGIDVVAVDPAAAMLDVAARKPHAERVRWIHGVVADVKAMQVDLACMTGNVAQVFLDDDEWTTTLRVIHGCLTPAGVLVFETRRPEVEGWLEWNRNASFTETEIANVGVVQSWYDVLRVDLPFVTFQATICFPDGTELVSESTLRFRSQVELEDSLARCGFRVHDIREAWDRPGKEFVVIATRSFRPISYAPRPQVARRARDDGLGSVRSDRDRRSSCQQIAIRGTHAFR